MPPSLESMKSFVPNWLSLGNSISATAFAWNNMLSSRAKYALRACIYLARRYPDDGWSLAPDIAEAEDLPHKFLEAILVELRDHDIVESHRGRYGGYRLARRPAEIAASDIIRLVDGPLALAPCASRKQFGACADCSEIDLCSLSPMLLQARDAVAAVLEGYSLDKLARKRRAIKRHATR
jgi:Rrf2 family protein